MSFTVADRDNMIDIELKLEELHRHHGLDISNPATITPQGRVAGDVDVKFEGDGVHETRMTRQP